MRVCINAQGSCLVPEAFLIVLPPFVALWVFRDGRLLCLHKTKYCIQTGHIFTIGGGVGTKDWKPGKFTVTTQLQ